MALMPVAMWADDSGTCGENLTWTYEEATKTLTISGDGEMDNYSNLILNDPAPWSSYRSNIQKVVIDIGVRTIGDEAFYDCKTITSVSIPSSVNNIGAHAFANCIGLISIDIPEGVTTIDIGAFRSCI